MPDEAVDRTHSASEFVEIALENRFNAEILDRLPALDIPQCHLVAGCLFQTVWNRLADKPADHAISDYDIFYFDGSDLSWEAEDTVIKRVAAAFDDLPIRIDVKNQARVHLWYEEKFGAGYPQLQSARDGIGRYLVECTCVGIETASRTLYAPYGLDDIWRGRLKMNPKNPRPDAFVEKAQSYKNRWPFLTIVPPGEPS